MFFCGDVSVSGRYDNLHFHFDFVDGFQAIFLNLEGALCSRSRAEALITERVVFNIDEVVGLLRDNHVTGCILANNHITDFDDEGLTLKKLQEANIQYAGYGLNRDDAAQPIYFSEDGENYCLLAFGWYVTACKYAKRNKPGVNAMEIANVLDQIRRERGKGRKVIVVFHWNYVYELYPMPAQRELAKKAVDAGASLIIGCHPHCVEGIEIYQNVPIIYSLGNWVFDNGVYFHGELTTKELGLDELVAEYRDGELYCHWYRFDAASSMPIHISSERASDSARIAELTPYQGMDDDAYIKWFKKNKTVRIFMPVFTKNKHIIRNAMYYQYAICRGRMRKLIRCITGR